MTSIGVIGCGNMGTALIRGILKSRIVPASHLLVWDADPKKPSALRERLRVRVARNNTEVAKADLILLAVKPQQMGGVLTEIRSGLSPRSTLVSIAAGVPTRWIESRVGGRVAVVRVMPNSPALVGEGISAIAGGRRATAGSLKTAEKILRGVGEVVRVPEKWMDAVTAVSGSGPAYFFFLMEQMIQTGLTLGLSRSVAQKLAVQTAVGAARLAAASQEKPSVLRAKVTSKGGTTEAAFKRFARLGLGRILQEGIQAAAARSRQLGKQG